MKKEYLARVILKYNENEPKPWTNAMLLTSCRRYAATLEEAQNAIKWAIERGEKKPKRETVSVNGIGIDIEPTSENGLKVVKWEILARDVTPWDAVEVSE